MIIFLRDIRYAIRLLLKSPGFTAIAVLSLALGIGANTAVFNVINAVLLKALPYHQSERLVLAWGDAPTKNIHRGQVSATDIADLRARNHVFEEICTYASFRPVLTGAGEPERISGAQVGDGFFRVMGGEPLLGRVFTAEEQTEGKDYVAVVGYGLWQRRFGGDPGIVGRTLMLSGRPYTVIGIMPADFHSLPAGLLDPPAEFYRPVAELPEEKERASRHLRAIGRLKPGVTQEEAQTEINLIARQLEQEHPTTNAGGGIRLVSLRDDLVSPVRPALLMLFSAVALLLLIACANVGNLLLARSIARHKEVAIRAALGAGRGRLVRQFLTESLLLALAGGVLGLMGALWSTSLIEKFGARVFPMLGTIELDGRVLGFTFVVSILTGVLFGCAPALRATRRDLSETLNQGGRDAGASSTRSPLRSTLVIIEVALAMILLIGSGLLIKSIFRLRAVNPGFKSERLVTMNVWLPQAKYPKAENWQSFYDRLLARLRVLPGVEVAGLTSVLPVSENFDQRTIEVEGQARGPGEHPDVENNIVTPDYPRTMAMPLLGGRFLTEQDKTNTPFAAVVSDALARKLWPGDSALGKRLRFYNSEPVEQRPWRTVVGVVGDVKQYGLDTPGTAALYVPLTQMPASSLTLAVRTRADPNGMVAAIRREILALDPDQAVFNIATMEELLSDSISLRRFSMFLLGIFAGLALVLAAIGIYGVLAQLVAQRTHEIGIRMALGAQTRDVLRLIVAHGMMLTLVGIIAGILGALGLTRLIVNLLFGVGPTDAVTFAGITVLLSLVALLACYIPARRAAKLDPVSALARG